MAKLFDSRESRGLSKIFLGGGLGSGKMKSFFPKIPQNQKKFPKKPLKILKPLKITPKNSLKLPEPPKKIIKKPKMWATEPNEAA